MKEQIDREYKEIKECKKIIEEVKKAKEPREKKDKKSEPQKATETYKSKHLERIISPCRERALRDTKKFSTPNEPFFSNSMGTLYKMLSIQSSIINGGIPIISKLIF